jgi:hypothetical protein
MKRFIFISIALVCIGCAPDFSGADIHYKEKHSSSLYIRSFSLKVNNQSLSASPKMISAYSTSLSKANLHPECKVDVSIQETIHTEKKSLWYLGTALMIPFWPAQPMKGFIRLQSSFEIFCNQNLIQRLDFFEEEDFDFFWYGAFRSYEIENRLEWLHEKMIKRFEFALQYDTPVDAGCASDF